LKLIALVLAVIIWLLVVGEKRSEVRLTVPLELRNLPARFEITEQNAAQVEVAVRGFSSVVKKLTPGDIDVYIDLTNIVEGPNSFALVPDDIFVPVGATVIQVSPSQIEVMLDATGEKTLPIKPMSRGTLADGYTLGKMIAEPKVITVVGSRRLLNTISSIETETVVLDNVSQDFTKKVKPKLPQGIRIEKEEEKIISVSVTVIPNMVDRFFEEIPLQVEKESRQFTLSPQTITALMNGPELELSAMNPADIPAFIRTKDLPEGISTVEPEFQLPESVTVKSYYPKIITITIAQQEK
jgi:YbbR domain-containing protein